ncbi:fibronectin type III domain-containing protein [Segetibacter sp. 3557_3]|uniref:fibronectin type III domain-containing protein n=1 Tax=Segetibacter sp. 3557_3 TaxID=2547429 RepID=UPI0014053906|nr:T9SS type A sorting domain-containing protein [Segetibacter sp. 3557_3]
MKHLFTIFFLFVLSLMSIPGAFAQAPQMQASIRPGATVNSVDVYFKSSTTFSGKDEQLSLTLLVPATTTPQPFYTTGSPVTTANGLGPVAGIGGLIPSFLVNNLGTQSREVNLSTQTVNGVSYYVYTFVFAGAGTVDHSWTVGVEQQVFSIQFNGCPSNFNRDNTILASLANGGSTGANYFYFQVLVFGDVTNEQQPFYQTTGSTTPVNGGSYTQNSFVSIVPNNQPPVLSGGSNTTASIAENSTVVRTIAATDADNDPLTYAISCGADASQFSISSTGVLSFNTAPNFESPADANGDNVYEVVVRVSDGKTTADQTLLVTVTDVNENATATVTTNAPTSVSTTAATLNGSVNANGSSTTVTFEYGLTAAYGSSVPATPSPVTGTSATAVSATISSLAPNTQYHYRAVGVNAGGTSNGNDVAFYTLANTPGAPTVSNATTSTLDVSLASSANGNPATTVYAIAVGGQYVQANGTLGATPVFQTIAAWGTRTVTGLTPSTSYSFTTQARNGDNVLTAFSAAGTGSTLAPPNSATVITNAPTAVSTTAATLNGSVNANGSSTTVTFEYGLTAAYGSSVPATPSSVTGTSATAVSATISSLGPNTQYHYRAVGVNAGGTSNGNDVAFYTLANTPGAPTVSNATTSTLDVSLASSANGNPATTVYAIAVGGQYVQANGTLGATPVFQTIAAWGTRTVTGLTPSTSYSFTTQARNGDNVLTAFSAAGTGSTLAPPNSATVTTNAPTSVSTTAATLNGSVNANGSSTTVTFEYGLTAAYGSSVPATPSPVTGTSATAVSATISSLAPNTQYHYRAVGVNAGGTSNGNDVAFYTLANTPGAPTVSNATTSTLDVSLASSANGNPATTVYAIAVGGQYVQANGTLGATPVFQTIAAWGTRTVTGLTPSTSYSFTTQARNGDNVLTAFSAAGTGSTLAPPNSATVTTNAPTAVSTTAATLNGSVNANGSSTTVTFEYGLTAAYGSSVPATPSPVTGTSATAVSATISSLAPNTQYHYRAVGVNAGGTSNGNDVAFYTLANTPGAPTVSNATTNTLDVSLASSANGNPATTVYAIAVGGQYVQANGTLGATPVFQTIAAWGTRTVTGLTPSTSYSFTAQARNGDNVLTASSAAGTGSTLAPPNSATVTTNAPTAVSTTAATLNGSVNANGSSTTVTFEYGLTAAYGSSVPATPSPVTGTSATAVSATISSFAPNTQYHYRAVGVNAGGTSNGNDVAFYTLANTPGAPTVSNATTNTLDVSLASSANGNPATTVYAIAVGGQYVQANGTLGATPVFQTIAAWGTRTVTGLTPSTSYSFTAQARNGDNVLTASSAAGTGSTLAPPNSATVTTNAPTAVSTTAATLNGSVNANGSSTTVTFEYGLTAAYGSSVPATPSPVTGTSATAVSATISSLAPNTQYHYRAVGVNAGGTSNGNDVAFYTLANTPGAPTVSNATTSTLDVSLASSANGNPATTVYAIAVGGQYVQANGTLGATPVFQTIAAWGTRTVTGLTPSTSYSFTIQARNGDNVLTAFSAAGTGSTSGSSAGSSITDNFRTRQNGNWGDANTWESSPDNFSTTVISPATISPDFRAGTITVGHAVAVASPVTTDQTTVSPSGALTVTTGSQLNINDGTGFDITVNGTLTVTGGANMIVRSGAAGTASVGPSSGTINGEVTVERYIPDNGRRAWRLLSVPVAGSRTIRETWQENGRNIADSGTIITSPLFNGSNGFDMTSPASSILMHNQGGTAGATWSNVPSTLVPLSTNPGYMLFVRGDRTATPFNSLHTPTTLRSMGNLKMGTQAQVVSSTGPGYTLVGNPYASPVDFETIATTPNLNQQYYIWDANLTGRFGVGGFRVVERTGANTYRQTPEIAGGTTSDNTLRYLHSGQAFLLKASGSDANVVFTEASKTDQVSTVNPFRTQDAQPQLLTNLMIVAADNSTTLADGTRVRFDKSYSPAVTHEDVIKISNFAENLGLRRENKLMIVEKRHEVAATDTIYLDITNMGVKSYQLEVTGKNMPEGLVGYVVDKYKNTQIPVSLTTTTTVSFDVNADPGSSANDRFMIVLSPANALPVTMRSVKALQQGNNIALEWKVQNETNTASYEVEKSTDGRTFNAVNSQKALNNGDATYQWLDKTVSEGSNFYRIKIVSTGGQEQYSAVVNVEVGKKRSFFQVYPNPVTNGMINLQFVNKPQGLYTVRLVNALGQAVLTSQVSHEEGSSTEPINAGNRLLKGQYILEIISAGNKKETIKIIN